MCSKALSWPQAVQGHKRNAVACKGRGVWAFWMALLLGFVRRLQLDCQILASLQEAGSDFWWLGSIRSPPPAPYLPNHQKKKKKEQMKSGFLPGKTISIHFSQSSELGHRNHFQTSHWTLGWMLMKPLRFFDSSVFWGGCHWKWPPPTDSIPCPSFPIRDPPYASPKGCRCRRLSPFPLAILTDFIPRKLPPNC